MILVGQYDSPYVRRVAVSLRVLGFSYRHDQRSVFGDFDSMRQTNPLGRVPSLVLPDGEVLIDTWAILDWLDQQVGPERALLPAAGAPRRRALRLVALATGAIDKLGALVYERLIRPSAYRWPEWMERCRTQGMGAVEALAREPWQAHDRLDQTEITTACTIGWLRLTGLGLVPEGRCPTLDALCARCEALPAFVATAPANYLVPRAD